MARRTTRPRSSNPPAADDLQDHLGSSPQIETAIKRKPPGLLTKQTTAYGTPFTQRINRVPNRAGDFRTAINRALDSRDGHHNMPLDGSEYQPSDDGSVLASRDPSLDPDYPPRNRTSARQLAIAKAATASTQQQLLGRFDIDVTPHPIPFTLERLSRGSTLESARSFADESRVFREAAIIPGSDISALQSPLPRPSLDRRKQPEITKQSAPAPAAVVPQTEPTLPLPSTSEGHNGNDMRYKIPGIGMPPLPPKEAKPSHDQQTEAGGIQQARRPSTRASTHTSARPPASSAPGAASQPRPNRRSDREADDMLQRLLQKEMEAEQRSQWKEWQPWRKFRARLSKLSIGKPSLGFLSPSGLFGWMRRHRSTLFWLIVGSLASVLCLLAYNLIPPEGLTSRIPAFFPGSLGGYHPARQEEEQRMYEDLIKLYQSRSAELKTWDVIDKKSVSKLEALLPGIIRMTPDSKGRPMIPMEFWHALRDYIRQDGTIMTFVEKYGSYHLTDDEHWVAIKNRILGDPSLEMGDHARTPPHAAPDAAVVEEAISRTWEKWATTNNEKISALLGPMLTELQSKQNATATSGSRQDVAAHVQQIIKDQTASGLLVTRTELIDMLKRELKQHQAHVKSELQNPALAALIDRSVKASTQTIPPAGMTKAEVTALVKSLVQGALVDANLQGLANGKIQLDWQDDLQKRINYFGWGNGARIDGKHTTPEFSRQHHDGRGRGPKHGSDLPAHAAKLLKPFDPSSSFCGSHGLDRHSKLPMGAVVFVMLGREVVPDHIVLEHIYSGATLDPGAMPKDIEVWASYEELSLRNRVKDFSDKHLPSSAVALQQMPDTFVKIAEFSYESSEAWQGRYVHRLSDLLTDLQAATDQVAIRAVSNHGAVDHTCFYSMQLYGEPLS